MPPEISSELGTVSVTFLLASRGLLWVGTSVGCVLTYPLPRLEGVPQIKGRPNVSYHAHMGPIKFLTPIYCGTSIIQQPQSPSHSIASFSQRGSSRAGSRAASVMLDTDDRMSVQSGQDGSGYTLQLEGVTESCSEDAANLPFLHNMGETSDNFEDDPRGFTTSDQLGTLKRFAVYEPVNQKNKWVSTPDLRDVTDSLYVEEDTDINILYRNLLSGTDTEEYDNELLLLEPHKRRRRPFSVQGYFNNKEEMRRYKNAMLMRRGSKYSTLPIVREDCPVYPGGEESRDSLQMSGQMEDLLLNESLDNSFPEENLDDSVSVAMQSISLETSTESHAYATIGEPESMVPNRTEPREMHSANTANSVSSPVSPESTTCPQSPTPSLTGQASLSVDEPPIYHHPVLSPSPAKSAPSHEGSTSPEGTTGAPPSLTQRQDSIKSQPSEDLPPPAHTRLTPQPSRPSSFKTALPAGVGGASQQMNNPAKTMIVVSGGDGHINWSLQKPGDSRYEDICLLLWQYKL